MNHGKRSYHRFEVIGIEEYLMILFRKIIIIMLFLFLNIFCFAEKNESKIVGTWCIDSQNYKIDDFIIINKIDDKFLVIRMSINDKEVYNGIGYFVDQNTIKYSIDKNIFFLDWFEDDNGEWLEEYINKDQEEITIFERIENFSIDKF